MNYPAIQFGTVIASAILSVTAMGFATVPLFEQRAVWTDYAAVALCLAAGVIGLVSAWVSTKL